MKNLAVVVASHSSTNCFQLLSSVRLRPFASHVLSPPSRWWRWDRTGAYHHATYMYIYLQTRICVNHKIIQNRHACSRSWQRQTRCCWYFPQKDMQAFCHSAGGHVSTLSQPETLGIGSSSKVWMCKGAHAFKAWRGKLEQTRLVQISAIWWERVCVSLVWRV